MYDNAVALMVEDLNNRGIFRRTDFTFTEYVDALRSFQYAAAKIVIGDDASEDVQMNEVIARIESMAREKGKVHDCDVFHCINALKLIQKEIAVAMAGKKGEDRVANTFQYVSRPDARFYRNMYISNGQEETEIDAVVLTKNGVIILEIKNAKEDITISSDGRILFNNSSCYHDISIGEKLEKKNRGIDEDIVVEGLLVFSTPNGVHIRVTNQFHQVNYCFRGTLFKRIDSFESTREYSDMEINMMATIFQSIKTNQKRFELKFNPDEIKEKFARAIVALTYTPQEVVISDKIEENDPEESDVYLKSCFEKRRNINNCQNMIRPILGAACAVTAEACCFPISFALLGSGLATSALIKAIRG